MWLRILVPLLALGYVAYKGAVALEVRRARVRGDVDRASELADHGFGLRRFMLGLLLFLVCFVVLIAVLELR